MAEFGPVFRGDPSMSIHEVLYGWQHLFEKPCDQVRAESMIRLEPVPIGERLEIVQVMSGGFSNARIWKVGSEPGRAWCLRQWPANGPTLDHLTWIHAQMAAAADCGIAFLSLPVPARPFAQTVVNFDGRFWELSPWLTGQPVLTAGHDRQAMKLAIRAALELHQALERVDCSRNYPGLAGRSIATASPAIGRRLARLQRVGSSLNQIRSRQSAGTPRIDFGLVSDAMIAIENSLGSLVAVAGKLSSLKFRLRPVLSDLWCEHVLFENGKVSGVIDYASLCMDIPELPFARLVGSLSTNADATDVGSGGHSEGHDGWEDLYTLAGQAIPAIRLDPEIIGFLHKTNVILGCLNWLEWIFVQHREFANRERAEHRATQMMQAAIRIVVGE